MFIENALKSYAIEAVLQDAKSEIYLKNQLQTIDFLRKIAWHIIIATVKEWRLKSKLIML